MLDKYKHLIYHSEAEEAEANEEYCKSFFEELHCYTSDLTLPALKEDIAAEKGGYVSQYAFHKEWCEGKRLFQLAVNKYGVPLWMGLAWKDCDCKNKCPFGDGCENDRIVIDEQVFCMGQIYQLDISLDDVLQMVQKSHTSYYIDGYYNEQYPLNGADEVGVECGKEHLKQIWGKIQDYFYYFGDVLKENGSVYGENVISLLEQDIPFL